LQYKTEHVLSSLAGAMPSAAVSKAVEGGAGIAAFAVRVVLTDKAAADKLVTDAPAAGADALEVRELCKGSVTAGRAVNLRGRDPIPASQCAFHRARTAHGIEVLVVVWVLRDHKHLSSKALMASTPDASTCCATVKFHFSSTASDVDSNLGQHW
jgi:hypothetical protein